MQAAEALAELDRTEPQASQEPPKTGSTSVAALVSHAELEEHKRQLQSLRVERERLEDRVNTRETLRTIPHLTRQPANSGTQA